MDSCAELQQLRASLEQAERVQRELDQSVFHLKTLYDVSRELFASVDSEKILRTFLLMTMGNFGVIEGFILTMDMISNKVCGFIQVGLHPSDISLLRRSARAFLMPGGPAWSMEKQSVCVQPGFLPPGIACALPFSLGQDCAGLIGLGSKVVGQPYGKQDEELLLTLTNNLVVALMHARSFEEINRLNQDLQAKNIALEDALNELKVAVRKVEILEGVKASLSKFVPTTVRRLIDESPGADVLASREQDVSVLFLDVEGYTRMCHEMGPTEIHDVIEKYFSAFMDAIYENNGDVNETSGDGLMVIFQDEDRRTNALQAVRAAISIRERAASIRGDTRVPSPPLVVNMGINSGPSLVGAVKFESYTGSRWTYTATGLTTSIAARIGSLATGGGILVSKATAERIKDCFPITSRGEFKLRNVSEEMELFEV